MKYYYINRYFEKDENRSSIQIYDKDPSDDVMDDKGVYAFSRIDFPEISEIKYLLIEKGYDIYDVMNAPMLISTGILINQRTRAILMKFNLPNHKYYDTYLKDCKDKIYKYFWLQTSSERDCGNFLNYPKSQFYWKKDIGNMEREDIAINSIEDVKNFVKNLPLGQTVKLKTAVLKNEFAGLNMDLFKIGRLRFEWIVSERLKEALENANITGISFKEATNILVEE